MKTLLPTASINLLDELLEFLGERAVDFTECVDVESEWCWEYAGIVLPGIRKKKTAGTEIHHIIPACFYGKRDIDVSHGNTTVVSYVGHMYAHYCLAMCTTEVIHDSMVRTFRFLHKKYLNRIAEFTGEEAALIKAIDPASTELWHTRTKKANLNIRLDDNLRDVVDYIKTLPGGVTKWLHDRLHEVIIDDDLMKKLSVYTDHTNHT